MGHPRTTPKVLEALRLHRGRDVGISELQACTGLSDAQVRSAVRSLIERDRQPIKVVQRGKVWQLQDTVVRSRPIGRAAAAKKLADSSFYRVGQTRSGDTIVKGDQTDALYKLTEL